MTTSINDHESMILSQNGEAGILDYLIEKIRVKPLFLVEIGTGIYSNTMNLLVNHKWRGVLIDNDTLLCETLKDRFKNRDIQIINAWAEKDSINELLHESKAPRRIGILSIDIDGVDFHIWKAIKWLAPKIVVIEYNASFGPDHSITIPYSAKFNRHEKDPTYHGASLAALTKMAATKNIALVGCESSGCNAFFVARKLLNSEIREVPPAEAFYPARRRNGRWIDQFRRIQHLNYEEI